MIPSEKRRADGALSKIRRGSPERWEWEPPSPIEIHFPEKQLRSPMTLRKFRFLRHHRVEPFVLDITCMGRAVLFTWTSLAKRDEGKEQKK